MDIGNTPPLLTVQPFAVPCTLLTLARSVTLCARKVASVSGDVRRALEVCRLAAQVAEREEAAAHAAAAAAASGGMGSGEGGGVGGGVGGMGGGGGSRGHAAAGGRTASVSVARLEAPRYVTVAHITSAHKTLMGSNQQVAIQAAPIQHKLLLACMVLLMKASGKAEVDEVVLRNRHKAICASLDSNDVPPLSAPEQNEAIARLCASRLLDTAPTAGALRLTVQPEDVRATVRGELRLAHLFPTPSH